MDRKLKGEEHRDVGVVLTQPGPRAGPAGAASRRRCRSSTRRPSLLRRVTGRDHPLLARTLERQASALIDQGRARDALPLLDECVAINTARYGTRHPAVATALATSARARAALGEHAEAEALFREALDVQRQVRPKPHITTGGDLIGLGEVLAEQDRAAEAEPLLREALSQAEQSLPASHWRRGEVESALGACLWRSGGDRGGGPDLCSSRDTNGWRRPSGTGIRRPVAPGPTGRDARTADGADGALTARAK